MVCLATAFILMVGCSPMNKKSNELNNSDNSENNSDIGDDKKKEALYGQALMGLAEDNSSNNTALDKRFDYLEGLVSKILSGEKELEMATFTRIKIELDYLSIKNYDSDKVNLLSDNFMKAFTAAEKIAKQNENENIGSLSLNDRYFSLSTKIEKISSGKTKLKVAEYLQIEEGLSKLEQDGYIPSRVNSLRSKLFQAVIAELESAIVDYEPPELEMAVEKESEAEAEIMTENTTEIEKEVPSGPQTTIIKLIDGGFNTEAVKINVGDTVEWKNARKGRYKVGFVVGNRECQEVKSKIFKTGESFNFTFTKPMTCWISDGIFTTQAMRVIIS